MAMLRVLMLMQTVLSLKTIVMIMMRVLIQEQTKSVMKWIITVMGKLMNPTDGDTFYLDEDGDGYGYFEGSN